MLRAVLDLLYPPVCPACGAPGTEGLCAPCVAEIAWLGWACQRCALPPHGSCRGIRGVDRAASAALYEGRARDALLRFKLGGERRAARALAARMAPLIEAHRGGTAVGAGGGDVAARIGVPAITFVPATPRALRARGFNPAEALARAVARALGAPGHPLPSVVALLRKVRDTPDQAGLSRAERAANLSAAIAPAAPAPAHVVLIDDILTTGATAEACARALREAGAREVRLVTFARTP